MSAPTEARPYPVDLHVHSARSDGRLEPADVVAAARVRGVRTLALVDHDVVSGLAEAAAAGAALGVRVIAGIELTARWHGRTCHILGYYLDPTEPRLLAALAHARQAAEDAVDAGLAALQARGYPIDRAELLRYRARYPTPTTLLLAMVRRGLLRSRADVQALLPLLRGGGPAWSAADAIALIHGASGAAVLAHPGRRVGRVPLDGPALAELASAGLDGVEVAHPSHTPEQRATYAALAADLDLIATGGSDWHGRPNDCPIGEDGVRADQAERLQDRATRAAAQA